MKRKIRTQKIRVGAWLSSEEFTRLEQYAQQIGLDESSIAALSLIRAINRGALPAVSNSYCPKSAGAERVRITAALRNQNCREVLDRMAKDVGVSREGAIRLIIWSEVTERWLEKILNLESS